MEIGDDVATLPAGRGLLVVKTDMLVEGTDMPRGMSYREAARKAVAMCVSDFAAKGVRPDSFLVSLGLKRGVSSKEVEELGAGFRDAEKEWGVHLVGGDTNEARELVIDCSMFGFAKKLVARRGAKAGDALVVTGKFGYPPSGLRILSGAAKGSGEFKRRARRSVLRPSPELKVGLALGRYLSSAMDSSDGLARSLHTLARASAVGFELRFLPAGEGVGGFAKANGLDESELVLNGGEEYLIVGTVSRSRLQAASRAARRAGGDLYVIGAATGVDGGVVLRRGGASREIPDEGWTHLG